MATAMVQPTQEPAGSTKAAPVKLQKFPVYGIEGNGAVTGYTDQFGNPWADTTRTEEELQSIFETWQQATERIAASKVPQAPSTPAVSDYAQQQVALGREALDFAKSRAGITDRAANMQLGAAQDFLDYFKTTFQPLQKQIVSDASGFDTPERREMMAGEAVGDVNTQFANRRAATERQLAQFGVNPIQANARYGVEMDAAQSAAQAQAANAARRNVEAEGFARKTAAAGLGTNLPGQQVAFAGSGIGASDAGIKQAQMGFGQAQAGLASALGAENAQLGTKANIYNAQLDYSLGKQVDTSNTQRNLDTASSNEFQAFLGMLSSKKLKTGVKDHKDDPLMKVGIKDWRYKKGAGGAHQDDGKVHTGPMAEDFKKATGRGDGKSIDFRDEVEVTLNSVRGMRKEVRQLAARR